MQGAIVFDNVSFAYPGAEQTTCRGVSFSIVPGETVALMGPSGTGKSTLIRLLQRMYEPQGGRIMIGDVNTATLSLHTLRRSVAVAAQQPDLLNRSVRENIAYGRPDASFADIVEAARIAQADRFITELPDGYDTPVGERGARLSGGQRQRVALARALLADSPVVVLDEATSALDVATEEAILSGLRGYLGGRACIFITHRPSAARFADRTLHFVNGSVRSSPPHCEVETPSLPPVDGCASPASRQHAETLKTV
jgi:ATP-binding cassette subfamily B protein